MSRKNK
jgi:hypothetical protein